MKEDKMFKQIEKMWQLAPNARNEHYWEGVRDGLLLFLGKATIKEENVKVVYNTDSEK